MRTLLAGLLLPVVALAASENPIFRMFPEELTYMQSFDDGTLVPEVGVVKKVQDPSTCKFADGGVFGKCLAAGDVAYPNAAGGEPLMDTRAPGTLICWVRYLEEPKKGEWTGFQFFLAGLNGPGEPKKTLYFMKLNDRAMSFLYERYNAEGKRFPKSASSGVLFADWPKGRWRMLAATWGGGELGISQNGSPFVKMAYDEPLGEHKGDVRIRAPFLREKGRFYQVDEVAVLNRKLTDGEIRALYDRIADVRFRQARGETPIASLNALER